MTIPPPQPGPPLTAGQRAIMERGYETAVEHFHMLETRYGNELRTVMLEMDRRAAFGLDHRAYVREELEKWMTMFSVASRAIDNAAAPLGLDGRAVWGEALKEIGSFVTKVFGDLDRAEAEERDAQWRGAVEAKGKQMEGFAELLKTLRNMRW